MAANEWSAQALRTIDELKSPTSAVTQPTIVNRIVRTRHQAHDFIHTHIYTGIAADAAVIAYTWNVLQFPWSRLETKSSSCECTYRAYLHGIAREDRVKGVIRCSAHFHFVAS